VLLHKATFVRRKDQRDFDRCLPLLSTRQRDWLRSSIGSLYPGHAWLDALGTVEEAVASDDA
jgi:hypothetical protein